MTSLEEVEILKGISFSLAMLSQARRIDKDTIYTIAQAAFLVQCSKQTITRAIIAGKLQHGKVGMDFRVKGGDLIAWLDAGGKTGRTKGRY